MLALACGVCVSVTLCRIGEDWTIDELQMAKSNINVLELLAIKHALVKCLSSIRSSTVLFRSDNTTADSYINNMGGHGSYIVIRLLEKFGKLLGITMFLWHVHIWLVVKMCKLIL